MVSFGIIGPGKIGEALMRKINFCYLDKPWFYHPRQERCLELEEKKALGLSKSLEEVLSCHVVFITVRPSSFPDLVQTIEEGKSIKPGYYISLMAGVTLDYLKKHLNTSSVLRAMTDIGIGDRDLHREIFVHGEMNEEIEKILSSLGQVVSIDQEKKLNSVTALFSCGVAFVAELYRIYCDEAKRYGFDDRKIVHHLFQDSIHLLEGKYTPEELISLVETEDGITEDGLCSLCCSQSCIAGGIHNARVKCKNISKSYV